LLNLYRSFHLLKLIWLCLLAWLSSGDLFSRQAAYSILGKDQFNGVQIYDVIQDKQLNYWFSTNEGLIFYDHYSFKKIECTQSKSVSFFNFVINSNGTIFCNNLNNQIFSIQGQSCKLFYELLPDEKRNDVSLATSTENNLLISGQKLIVLNESGAVLQRAKLNLGYIGIPFYKQNGDILYSASNADSLVLYSHGNLSVIPFTYSAQENSNGLGVLQFFRIANQSYAIQLLTKSLYTFDESKYTLTEIPTNDLLKRSRSIRIYGTSNHLWAAGTLPGAILFDSNLTPENGSLLYADFFISDIYQDKEGNILLSTFDKGVLVITDINLPDLIADFKDDPITSINATSANGFIAGTSKGLLVNYDFQNFKTLSQKGSRPIETIVVNPSGKIIVFDDGGIRFLNTVTNEFTVLLTESLKDGVFVNDQTLFLATNSGLTKIIFEDLTFKKYSMEKIADLNIRNYAIEFDPINSLLYISTVNGLFCIDSSNQIKEIKYGGLPLFASTLSYESGKIYAPQSNPELLVIKGGEVIDSIRLDLENPTHIFKTTVYKNSVFANTSEGIYEFDKNGKFLRHFNNSYGNNYGRVLDFTIIDDILWVSNSSGLQTIDLNYAGEPAPVPLIEIAHIFANDIEISKDSLKRFDTEFRKFVFVVSSPTLKYKSDIKYHYQLKGYDEDWIIHDYASNEIVYNALAPGNYEFIVKAENQNKFSEPVSYKFSIASPFYATWWFVSILILTFLLSVYFIYKRQLNAQRLKARQINELNASKLTAIQSQMNPHFIFNSLNSIQDLILKGDVEHSYSYITTFSNLVRRTLNYSDKDFIDFEQELKLLELYLSLEKLRFKKDFSFSLETNSITDIQVPPMLIQPFIENALVHGLLHKEGEKKLKISFKLNDHLICTIEDNGIGRAQAKAIKERQRTDHESFSVQAIRKRFEILSNHFQGELGYTYEDLEENGKPSGTRVVLQIPVRHKF
jgi:hypothetical protein